MDTSDAQVRLAEAHARAGNELTDRYADHSLSDAQFEGYLARLRSSTSIEAVEGVLADLRSEAAAERSGMATPVARSAPLARRPSGSVLPPGEDRVLSVMTETVKKGSWRVPQLLKVRTVMSDVKLDFRHTEIPFDFQLDVVCVMAAVKIIVPLDMAISSTVSPIAGSFVNDAADVSDDPLHTIRVMQISGSVVLGEVKVVPRARSR